MFDIPILLIVFNRPETTQKVVDVLKQIEPKKLFIVADGPRKNIQSDRALCKRTQIIVHDISWKCDVRYLIRRKNKGCGKGVADGISWFFRHVQEGIILEDDCLPDTSFFPFCKELLTRYRNDHKIMQIGGDNFQGSYRRGSASYYFSIFPHSWGWATWRRAWKLYNYSLKSWDRNIIAKYFSQQSDILYWQTIFDRVQHGGSDIWDYQWSYACWKNRGLCIIPQKNLVTNIGMDSNATHTKNIYYLQIPNTSINFPLTHPKIITPFQSADDYTQHHIYLHGASQHQIYHNNVPLYKIIALIIHKLLKLF